MSFGNRLCKLKRIIKVSLCLILVIFVTYNLRKFTATKFFQNYAQVFQTKYRKHIVEAQCFLEQSLPNGEFCLSWNSGITTGYLNSFDGQVCKNIETFVQHSTIVDFGAGLGHYGRCLLREPVQINVKNEMEKNLYTDHFKISLKWFNLSHDSRLIKSYEGYDGSVNIEEITKNFIKPINLAVEFDLGKRFDWVMSLEVGEHIPKAAEDIFLGNLIRHSCKGIILSWAIPDQKGLGHINCQSNEYIISKMKNLGLVHDMNAQNQLRNGSMEYAHFKNTLMVFHRPKPIC